MPSTGLEGSDRKAQSVASRGKQKSHVQCSVMNAADRGNNLRKEKSTIEILLSFSNVSGTMVNAATHGLTGPAQWSYGVDAMVSPILQLKKLNPTWLSSAWMVKELVCGRGRV